MKVPLFNTRVDNPETFIKPFQKLLSSGKFILGEHVTTFETNLSKYLDVKYVVGVNSGTDALELALKSLGVKRGDYVLTTGFTYFATIEAIHNVGAIPYLIDIDRQTLQIDFSKIKKSVLEKSRFIIPVHLFGGSVDIPKLKEYSKKYNLLVVEDVAQSFGSSFKGKFLGTIGDVGAFSFYPTKTLGSIGDAGAVVTNSKSVYKNLLKLRNHGHIDRDNFKFAGKNSRLDEIQAIYLNSKLKNINAEINIRKKIAHEYYQNLKIIENLQFFNNNLQTYNYFPIAVNSLKERNLLIKFLTHKNIDTAIYYKKPLTDLNFEWIEKEENYDNIDYIKKRILCLPIHSSLKQSQINYVIKAIKEFYET
jgi:dTDP-4-amino-4,6-dideoxygalactose transaminase